MSIDDEVRRAAKLLETLIQVTGASPEQVEQRLEASPGYLGRLFAGRVELKLWHILAILRSLEIEPLLFFQALYPGPDPAGGTGTSLDEVHQRLEALGIGSSGDEAAPPGPGVEMDDLERLVQEAVRAALIRRKPGG